jgi:hypothetical protein
MQSRINDDGCFEGGQVRVYWSRASGSEPDRYQIHAGDRIVLETRDLLVANGIAATFAALAPQNSYFKMDEVLDSLRDLVSARRFLAEVVGREALVLGKAAAAVQAVSGRLYGSDY